MEESFEISLLTKFELISAWISDLSNQIQDMNHRAPTLQENKERALINSLNRFESLLSHMRTDLEKVDISKTYAEIKYIGKRLNEIEQILEKLSKHGVEKRVVIDVSLDKQKFVPMTTTYDSEDKVYDQEQCLHELLSHLTEGEIKVVVLRCGFDSGVGMTYKDISKKLGLSSHRCSQVFRKAMRRISTPKLKNLVLRVGNKEIMSHCGYENVVR